MPSLSICDKLRPILALNFACCEYIFAGRMYNSERRSKEGRDKE